MKNILTILLISILTSQTVLAFQTDPVLEILKGSDSRSKDWQLKIHKTNKEYLAPYSFVSYLITDEVNYKHIAYGTGLAVIGYNQNNKPYLIWNKVFIEQDPPHSIYFIDFNKDGHKEIMTYSGQEETSITRIYFNNLNTDNPNMSLVYENLIAYSTIVDFEKDGILEIIDPVSVIVPPYIGWEPDYQFDLTQETELKINNEFDKIKVDIDNYEHPYRSNSRYKIYALHIDAKTRIVNLLSDKVLDVSDKYQVHFCFRKNIIPEYQNVGKYIKESIDGLKLFYSLKYCPN